MKFELFMGENSQVVSCFCKLFVGFKGHSPFEVKLVKIHAYLTKNGQPLLSP